MTSASERYRALTAPRRVALIGASSNPARLTARPQRFLAAHGFSGEVLPVNPSAPQVLGVRAWPSIAAVDGPVDHACVLLGTDAVLESVSQCAAARIPVVSVLADGFADAGPDGLARQAALADIAAAADMLLLGPNSMGVVDTRSGFVCTTNAAFGARQLRAGRIAVISQSGSVIGTLLSRGDTLGVGFSTLVSVGNEALTGIGDVGSVGDLLLEDPDTDAFVLFLETLRDAPALARFAARAHARAKPLFAYVVGRSEAGQALSVSHTGAMIGGIAALDAWLRHHGIVRVDVLEALIEAPAAAVCAQAQSAYGPAPAAAVCAQAQSAGGRPEAVTVVTTTGGGGAMVVDQLSVRGIEVQGASPNARSALAARGITLKDNTLIDVTLAGANYDTMKAVVATLLADPASGLVLAAIGSSAQFNPELAVRPLIDALAEAPDGAAPLFAFPLPEAAESLGLLRDGGVASFRTLESCAESVAAFFSSRRALRAPTGIACSTRGARAAQLPAALTKRLEALPATADEAQAMAVFEAAGVPAPRRARIDLPADGHAPAGGHRGEPVPLAFPVAAKLLAPGLAHKSEVGAVRLGIADQAALRLAVDDMRALLAQHDPELQATGVLVVEMVAGVGELIVGLTRDPLVGPVISVGLGGTFAELYGSVVLRPAPVCEASAAEMLDAVPGITTLRGYRGRPAGDLASAARAVAALSVLATDPRVAEAEVNPLLVREEGVVMLDALLRLEPPAGTARDA